MKWYLCFSSGVWEPIRDDIAEPCCIGPFYGDMWTMEGMAARMNRAEREHAA